jgi:hypothetical protein
MDKNKQINNETNEINNEIQKKKKKGLIFVFLPALKLGKPSSPIVSFACT